MTLARRYHLHGLFIGGLVLFGLFIWRNGVSLVPPRSSANANAAQTVQGQSATAGLVSLLRRGVPRPLLLQRCLEAWERSASLNPGGATQSRLDEARILVQQEARKPRRQIRLAQAYQHICAVLHPKR
jgi:hypothetical protein